MTTPTDVKSGRGVDRVQRDASRAQDPRVRSLLTLDELCAMTELLPAEVHVLSSTRGLPAWLVDGRWRYDRAEVDAWIADHGGRQRVQAEVRQAIARHRQARERDADIDPVRRG